MTREHVPPRSAGNDSPFSARSDPFDVHSVTEEVSAWQDGHTVSTLCTSCNARASAWGYVAEYRRWYDVVADTARSSAAEHHVDPLLGGEPFGIDLPYDAHPARFVRQVIGMFLAIQDNHYLFGDHPRLSTLIDDDPNKSSARRVAGLSIAPLTMSMAVDNGPYAYFKSPAMTVSVDLENAERSLWTPPGSRSSNAMLLMARFAPFAFFVTDGGPHPGLDITDWATWDVDRRPRPAERRLMVPTVRSLGTLTAGMLHPEPSELSPSTGRP